MFGYKVIKLKNEKGINFFYNKRKIDKLKREIEELLDNEDFIEDYDLTRKMLFFLEIKTNNAIEDLNDDLEDIKNIILRKKYLITTDRSRIINLFNGYRYILSKKNINKENLRELYGILSFNQLDDYSQEHMGKYYRDSSVFILNNSDSMFSFDFDKGVAKEKIDPLMNDLLEYLNENVDGKEIDTFIKSQIAHFYFVYIHPYFDVNGRTARTVSLWYLINNKAYPYTIFNRGLSLSKGEYKDSIKKSRKGNITPFLEYSLKTVKKELEKEIIIYNIASNVEEELTSEEYEVLEYLLSTEHSDIKEVVRIFNRFNEHNNKQIINKKIMPLIEKGILVLHENKLQINRKLITINKDKEKQLSLSKYVS